MRQKYILFFIQITAKVSAQTVTDAMHFKFGDVIAVEDIPYNFHDHTQLFTNHSNVRGGVIVKRKRGAVSPSHYQNICIFTLPK